MSVGLAGILTLMAAMQLFTFDEFSDLLGGMPVFGGGGMAWAAGIIVFEVFALPFLLRMALSPAFRWVSAACCALASLFWLFVTSYLAVSGVVVESVGFSGGLGHLTPGWWAVFVSLGLSTLSAWSLWGLWPRRSSR